MLKYAPNIDRMQRVMKAKLNSQLEQNDQRLQQRFQAFNDTEADLRKRLKQLEAQN
jgi:chaperonin cofactor prefoldin